MEDASKDDKEFDEVLVVAFHQISRVASVLSDSVSKFRDHGITVRSLSDGEAGPPVDLEKLVRDLLD